jgi:broad-specificity NMP kinase
MNADVLVPDLSVILSAAPPTLYERLEQRGKFSRFDQLEGIAELEDKYFRDAKDVLREAGYRVLSLETDTASISDVADLVEREVGRSS